MDLTSNGPTTWLHTCVRWNAPAASSPAKTSVSSTRWHDYFDVRIGKGEPETYRQAHARLDVVLGGNGPLADRMDAHRIGEEIPPERLAECIEAFSSALRDRVRADYPLPDAETVEYQVVTDKPWSGFNYYSAATARRSRSTPTSTA